MPHLFSMKHKFLEENTASLSIRRKEEEKIEFEQSSWRHKIRLIKVVLTLTLLISEFWDPKIAEVLQMAHPSENASFKFYDLFFIQQQHFLYIQPFPDLKNLIWIKIAFSGQHEQNHLSKNVKKFGCDKKINLRNQSVKKPTIYDLLIIGICSLQNVNKHSSEMKN